MSVFLLIYFYFVKFSCQNTILIFKKNKITNESYKIRMEKNAKK